MWGEGWNEKGESAMSEELKRRTKAYALRVMRLCDLHSAFRNLHYFLTAPNATRYNGVYGTNQLGRQRGTK